MCLVALPVVDRLSELFTFRCSGKSQFHRNLEIMLETTSLLTHFLSLINKKPTCYDQEWCTSRQAVLESRVLMHNHTTNNAYTRELRRCLAEGEAEKGEGQSLF
jgi:alpha-ketoglutarate-dependent taurine dioxygenase